MAQLTRHRCPPYPYGPALHYKQSNSGLYGGSSIQFGNQISEKNEIKTRRAWRPNIHNKRLWSDALGKFLAVRVQARVLRTIDKVGGLDEYLLGEKSQRIKELGEEGWRLRWKVMRSKAVRERFREERKRLGLPADGYLEQKTVAREVDQKVDGVEEEVDRVRGEVVHQIEAADGGEPEVAETDNAAPIQGEPAQPVDHSAETVGERVQRTAKDIEARRPQSKAAKPKVTSTTQKVRIRDSKPPGTRWGKAEKRAYRQQLEERKMSGWEDQDVEQDVRQAPRVETYKREMQAELSKPAKPLMDTKDTKESKGGVFERIKRLLRR